MKNILIICYVTLFLAACSTSKTDEKVNEKANSKTNQQIKKEKAVAQKPKQANKQKPKKAKKSGGNYYQDLKKALNLQDTKISKLKAIGVKYQKKLKAIPKSNNQLIKKTKAQKQQEIKSLLGEKLYLEKVAFDKKF